MFFNNTNQIINKFIGNTEDKESDYLKRENSNFVYSLPLLRKNISNFAEETFLMDNIFPKELVRAYEEGVVYIHDKQLSSYCLSVSCKDVATKGIPTLAKNMIASKPTKKLPVLLRHFSNIVVLMSQQVSGAVMLSQMTTVLASYLHYEENRGKKYSEDDLKQLLQSLIWELNMPLRSGSESAFSNATLEFGRPSDEVKDDFVVIGGELQLYQYKDIPAKYFDKINKAIIDVMAQGTGNGIPFTFPLLTVPIDDDFNFENKMFLYLLDKMYKWGGIYLENFRTKPFEDEYYKKLNPYIKPRDPEVSRSLCCRLQIDLSLLKKVGSGIFGSSTGSTGAVQVLNLNLNRIMIEHGHDRDLMYKKIREYFEIMEQGHLAKRKWIEEHKELYPTLFAFNEDLKNYFNVFAVTGMHEGLINMGYKDGMKDKEGKLLAHEVMQYITTIVHDFIDRDRIACGIEYAPAENAGIKLARADIEWGKKHNREVFVQGSGEDVFLTAGCMLPFAEKDFFQQIENSAEFQAYATSGSILHHFVESKVEPEMLAKYIDKIFQKPINYITLTPTITSCMSCGQMLVAQDGKYIDECLICGSNDIATFSRVIGYVKPIARKNLHVTGEGKYEGDYNFWSSSRRIDWNERRRFKFDTAKDVIDK